MSVFLQQVYEDIVAELGTGVGNDVLEERFPRAVNRATGELSSRANLSSPLIQIDSISAELTDVAARHEYVIYAGVRHWLGRMGVRLGDPQTAAIVLADARKEWDIAIGNYIADKSTALMDAGEEDIALQGYLG